MIGPAVTAGANEWRFTMYPKGLAIADAVLS
jgi:hypothetical protein